MNISETTLFEISNEYPFIVRFSYNPRNGDFQSEGPMMLVQSFIHQYVLNNIIKHSDCPEAQISVLELLDKNWDDLLSFGEKLSQAGNKVREENHAKVKIPLCNVWLDIKQFGRCLGFKLLDGQNNKHEQATSLLLKLIGDHKVSYVTPLIEERRVISPCWREDVVEQLGMMVRYVPDVNWYVSESESLTFDLHKDYVDGGKGVVVGMYHDIPVYMKVLDGREDKSDHVWRKGALGGLGTKLTFSREANCSPLVQFSIRMYAPSDFLTMASADVDYCDEQYDHRNLISIILRGLEARQLATRIAGNPLCWNKAKTKVVE